MRFCIPNYDIYRTDREDGLKGDTAIEVKEPSLTHASTYLLYYQ
jgi:hypothetical protein